MGNMTRALAETRQAFDGVAAGYDRSNAENPLLCAMRTRVRRMLEKHVSAGSHLLDLGCGPGSDAVYLAGRGYRVTAIDWSPAMVAEAGEAAPFCVAVALAESPAICTASAEASPLLCTVTATSMAANRRTCSVS